MNRHQISTLMPALAAALASQSVLFAEIKPNPLFTDGAVLQSGQSVPVWGTARDGEKVTVEIGEQKVSTTATNGLWRVNLKPLTAGGPFTMTLTGDNVVTVNQILVGEVWVCSGQSNMEWPLQRADNADQEIPLANYPKIRMFTVKKNVSIKPLAEAEGRWVECSPASAGGFSAVGYFFARDLYQKLDVPVGMIHTSWGGTPAESWTSIEGLGKDPELKAHLDAAQAAIANYPTKVAAYSEKIEAFTAAQVAWEETVNKPYAVALEAWKEEVAQAKLANQALPEKPKLPSQKPSRPEKPDGNQNSETTLFNGMLNPIVPYAIKGTIWYQGESNANRARLYRTLFPVMIADWREKWNQGNFPFLFVQIAPYRDQPAEIREAQLLTLAKSENTAMTVITDFGNANDIHPTQKEPVGHRLSLAARALAYGEKIEYSGPLYQSKSIQSDTIILSFTHVGGGLVAKDGDLKGFTIAAADGKFVPAKAVIEGTTIRVSAPDVKAPQAVRFGWENVPDLNLFNTDGLPASPFRTDVN